MLLLDVALAHADDWFSFPVPRPEDEKTKPSSGVLVTLEGVTVRDSFDQTWTLNAPPASGTDAWSLFHSKGLSESQLLIWPVAVAPHVGPVLDEILIGVDEDANLAWAVELRADGMQLLKDAETATAIAETTRTGTRVFRYLPSTTLPNGWHPYERVRVDDPLPTGGGPGTKQTNPGSGDGRSGDWRQAVLADLTGVYPRFRPGPLSRTDWRTVWFGPGPRTSACVDRDSKQRRDAAAPRDARARHERTSRALGRAQHGAGLRTTGIASPLRRVRGSGERRGGQ